LKEEPFFAITLDIKNKKSIQEALDLYIKPDLLEGDNQFYCDKYKKKLNASKRSYLQNLNNTVILNLKRFDFDYNKQMRFKVNDYCEFPMKLNFKPWTKAGIREKKQDGEEGKEEKKGEEEEDVNIVEEVIEGKGEEEEMLDEDEVEVNAIDEEMEDVESDSGEEGVVSTAAKAHLSKKKSVGKKDTRKTASGNEELDDKYYIYELVGVLVHSGNADSGHYYSYIKQRGTERWLEFNDTRVTEFDAKNLPKECFGG